jgi:hypothetical protein
LSAYTPFKRDERSREYDDPGDKDNRKQQGEPESVTQSKRDAREKGRTKFLKRR